MSDENKNNSENFDSFEDGSSEAPELLQSYNGGDADESANENFFKKQVSMSTFVCSIIAACLAVVMLTVTICNATYKNKLAGSLSGVGNGLSMDTSDFSDLALLDMIFKNYTFENMDEEQIRVQLLKAYVNATGDRYAAYYTDEEYAELVNSSMLGNSVGIGVRVIESSVTVGGVEYKAMKVVDVVKDAPAHKAGVLPGDFVVAIGNAQENTTLNVTGYDTALNRLRGEKGTVAEFAAYRPQGTDYELKFFSIVRDEYVDYSVTYKKVDADVDPTGKTGIVKINSFNHTTPTQFDEAIEALKAEGCDKFVFDLRDNLGGELTSIVAVLSRFLDEGKLVISTKDNADNVSETIVKVVVDDPNSEIDCPVSKQDLAKYKGLNCIVLCNENTASAAELFVANFRDYSIAPIIGATTYGKGTVQRYLSLAYYGIPGVLKMTVFKYFPPCGEGYDGIGIVPNVTVELSEEARRYSSFELFGKSVDNQLVEAVKYFK